MTRWPKHKLQSYLLSAPCMVRCSTDARARALRAALYRLGPPDDIVLALEGPVVHVRRLRAEVMEMTKL